MRSFEKRLKNSFEKSIIISDVDRIWLGLTNADCTVVPNYVDTDYFKYVERKSGRDNTIVFLGNMSYPPNHDALTYFFGEIWPLVLESLPNTILKIIGNTPSKRKKEYESAENVVVTGYVEDIRPHLEDAKLMIAPLRIGSGVANKILNGLAVGVPVVCTPRANEGIGGDKSQGIFVEDSEKSFAEVIVEILSNYDLFDGARREGRLFVEDGFSTQKHREFIAEVFGKIIIQGIMADAPDL